jgi:CheY-like chemotaxis protein
VVLVIPDRIEGVRLPISSVREFVETNTQARVSLWREERERPVAQMIELNEVCILVVEDDPDARELMQAVLEQRGATVAVAESVARAFELIEATAPDVIISDIAMPEEDGVAFVRRLRAVSVERIARIPAIAVSAYVASSDRARAIAAGFDHYLHKPVDFEELIAVIQTALARHDKAIA